MWITHSFLTTFCPWVCGLLHVFAIVNDANEYVSCCTRANPFLVIYPGVESLGCICAWSGLENATLFQMRHDFIFSSMMYKAFCGYTSSPILDIIRVFNFVLLLVVKWYLIVVLICISFTIRQIDYLFICLLAISVFFSVNCLFISLEYFLTGYLCFHIG